LLDVGAEGHGVHRAFEQGRRGEFRGAERRDDRMRQPVAARRVIPNARAAKAAGALEFV
jgi:hypothetical protein